MENIFQQTNAGSSSNVHTPIHEDIHSGVFTAIQVSGQRENAKIEEVKRRVKKRKSL